MRAVLWVMVGLGIPCAVGGLAWDGVRVVRWIRGRRRERRPRPGSRAEAEGCARVWSGSFTRRGGER